MTAEVNSQLGDPWHAVRFGYDPEPVRLVKNISLLRPQVAARRKSWRLATPPRQSTRYEMDAHGYLVTGLESEPEKRKQQRNGDMYCSSRCDRHGHRRRGGAR